MKYAFGKWAPTLLLLPLLILGCKSQGSQFVGKWVNATNPSDRMEITRNGDQFLIRSSQETVGFGAIYKDGFLQMPGGMGTLTLTYVKSSDTLSVPGMLGQNEYKRVDHFDTSDSITVNTPKGTISANSSDTLTAADLGIAIYPGATQSKGGLRMNIAGKSMVTANFLTHDSPAKVMAFYEAQAGPNAQTNTTSSGGTISIQNGANSLTVTVTQSESPNNNQTQFTVVKISGS